MRSHTVSCNGATCGGGGWGFPSDGREDNESILLSLTGAVVDTLDTLRMLAAVLVPFAQSPPFSVLSYIEDSIWRQNM